MSDDYSSLSRDFKRLRKLYAAYLIAAAAALAAYFISRWATLAALGVCLIYYVFVVRPASGAYARAFVHVCAQSTLNRHLSQAVHTHESALDIRELRAASLIPANSAKGSILLHEGGRGQYRGRQVRLGDVTFTHSYTTLLGKTRHQFTNGLYVIIELGKDSGMDCRILLKNAAEEGSVGKMLRDGASLEKRPACAGMGEDWSLICAKGSSALPGDKLLEAVHRLDKAVGGWAAVGVLGSQLHIYIIDRLLGQRVNSRYAPDAKVEHADLVPELDEALRLADCL